MALVASGCEGKEQLEQKWRWPKQWEGQRIFEYVSGILVAEMVSAVGGMYKERKREDGDDNQSDFLRRGKVGGKVAGGWSGWRMLEEDEERGEKEEDNQSDFQLFAAKLWLIQKGLGHSPVKLFIRPISSTKQYQPSSSRQLTHREMETKTVEKLKFMNILKVNAEN